MHRRISRGGDVLLHAASAAAAEVNTPNRTIRWHTCSNTVVYMPATLTGLAICYVVIFSTQKGVAIITCAPTTHGFHNYTECKRTYNRPTMYGELLHLGCCEMICDADLTRMGIIGALSSTATHTASSQLLSKPPVHGAVLIPRNTGPLTSSILA